MSFSNRLIKRLQREKTHLANNRQIEKTARRITETAVLRPGERPVVFFNASTRLVGMSLNSAYSLLASWMVKLKGVPVVYFACESGMTQCVLGTQRDDPSARPPCKVCIEQSRHLFADGAVKWFRYKIDRSLEVNISILGLDELSCFTYNGLPLGELVIPSLRWILRRHHLEDDDPTRKIFRQYILSAWNVAQEFTGLLDETNPQSIVLFNGMFYPEATARLLAEQRGIKVVNHEVGLLPFSGFFTTGDATAYPIELPEDFELSMKQSERLDTYLQSRYQGNFSMAGIRFWPEMHNLSNEFMEKAKRFRQIVPVFTNVIFDTSQGHANVLFPNMFAWLDQVLTVIRERADTLFVIRAHPDETRPGKESRETVADWVKDRGADRLDNVLFVDSKELFSSYELIQRSKFVMVYNSTIGLEASLLGVPVLCGGKARFTQLPTVFLPASASDYRQKTEEFLAANTIPIPPEFQMNARRFLYYQLFKTSLPFDCFIEEDGVWPGFVRLKEFAIEELLPERSAAMQAIYSGLFENKPFYLE